MYYYYNKNKVYGKLYVDTTYILNIYDCPLVIKYEQVNYLTLFLTHRKHSYYLFFDKDVKTMFQKTLRCSKIDQQIFFK